MRLPNGEQAIVDLVKLRDYVLNPHHPRGRHKARVFASALEILQSDAEFLQMKLLQAAPIGDAIPGEKDTYGQRYILDLSAFDTNAGQGPLQLDCLDRRGSSKAG
jgi:hypothetical protein